MPELDISITAEALEDCAPEEGASYGLLSILAQGACLTEGIDHYIKGYRRGPLVSGYYLAEWLAWHWWRQRWEPRRDGFAWLQAHRMSTVGEGYAWPNITISSDGLRVTIAAAPSTHPDAKPFRYTSSVAATFPTTAWENAVDDFITQIIARLDAQGIKDTNLHRLASDLRTERADPALAHYRRIEALLGKDPDTFGESIIHQIIKESEVLGAGALDELAAQADFDTQAMPMPLSAAALAEIARREGIAASLHDGIDIPLQQDCMPSMQIPAWRWGVDAAGEIRRQEHLAERPIEDNQLAEMAGVKASSLKDARQTAAPPAFALMESPEGARIVLRAKRRTGRRFELARLLADRLFAPDERLHPATRAYTYRQKAQRALAAELLCPADLIIAELNGQYADEERREDLADQFGISPMVVQTQLVNRNLLPRDDLEAPQSATSQ